MAESQGHLVEEAERAARENGRDRGSARAGLAALDFSEEQVAWG